MSVALQILRLTIPVLALCALAQPSSPLANGVTLLRQGSAFAAVRALRVALALGDDRAHLPLAEAYFVLNQHKFFEEEVALAKAGHPDDAEPYYVEGRYLFQVKGTFDQAANSFEQALSRNPNHFKARCYLGVSLLNMQKPDQAKAQLLKAVESMAGQSSSFYLPYQTLASVYLQEGRQNEAEEAIAKAVAMAPQVAQNQFLLGKIAWAKSDGAVAMASLQKAVELDEAFLEAHYLMARIQRSRGDDAGAQRHLVQFKALRESYGVGRHP